jgi:hypothetical protein
VVWKADSSAVKADSTLYTADGGSGIGRAGFLAPLFWLGLATSTAYIAPTESNFCATVAIYPLFDAELDITPAINGDVEIGTC